jgi:hypothetical protein
MGLERLLPGEYPQVPADLLGLPICLNAPQTENERVAYVWVEQEYAKQTTYAEMCASLPMELVAMAVDPQFYNYINR